MLEYQLKFTSRGNHTFDNVDLKLTDRWNLYMVKIKKSHKTSLLVHSDPNEIKKAKRASAQEHIEITLPSMLGTETTYEMEGIRDYIPGDLLRSIEWKATSRLQKLMTKMFQKKEIVETVIMLDCSRNMRRTSGKISKMEHATVIAIHLTKILQSLRHPVALIAYDEFKTIKTMESTNDYKKMFEALTELPSQIKTKTYTAKETLGSLEIKDENMMEGQRFLSTIFPFLARGKRTIKHPSQTSGIYEAIRLILTDNKPKHLIIITDLETNIQSLYRSINIAHFKKNKIWLLTTLTPYYHLDKKQLTTEQLEHLYRLHNAREKIMLKLKKINIEIVELTPTTEGGRIIEKIRKKTS